MTLTDDLRQRVQQRLGVCPTCGQPTSGTRPLAESIGMPNTVLWRFLRGGDMTGRNIDKIVEWLDSQQSEKPTP